MAKLGFVLAIFLLGACLSATVNGLGGPKVGGRTKVKDVKTNQDIQDLGRYSVEQYNKQQQTTGKSTNGGGSLKFKEVVSAETQVVSGIKYYLKIAATTGSGTRKTFDAELVVKPWIHSKELLTFAPSHPR